MSLLSRLKVSRIASGMYAALFATVIGPIASAAGTKEASDPYPDMPRIAPPGVRIAHYLSVPKSARGPVVDPSKGYRTQDLGDGLYLLTDNIYQSMFLVYDTGVVVIDAPPSFATHIPSAVSEVTPHPITHVIYSHSHADHIGGASVLPGRPVIIAQRETQRLLTIAHDVQRPVPTVVFDQHYTLHVGHKALELSYHGYGHAPGNIYIYAPAQKVLMVVDVISPGWMPYRSLSLARNIPGLFRQVDEISNMPFDTLVGGHVARTGSRADVLLQARYMHDLAAAAKQSLRETEFGSNMDLLDRANPWALADNYMDRAAIKCVNALTHTWSLRLAGFDAYIWDHCIAMEESLRTD